MGRTWPQTAPPPGALHSATSQQSADPEFPESTRPDRRASAGRGPQRRSEALAEFHGLESEVGASGVQLNAENRCGFGSKSNSLRIGRVAASTLRSCQAAAAGARIAACRQGARDDECERADVCRLVCEVSVIRSVDRLLTTTYQFRSFVHSCLVAWGPPSVEAECDIVHRLEKTLID